MGHQPGIAPRLPEHRRLRGGEGPAPVITDAEGRTPDCPSDLREVLDPASYAEGTVLALSGPLTDGKIVLDEIVPARAPWSAVLRQGQVLTIVDVGGNQSGDCLLYNARDTAERYSVPDTITASGNIYVRTGTVLMSSAGNPMATVVANEIDRQDTIGGACGKESNSLRYGHHTTSQHGCRENFLAEAARHGMGARDIVSNLNWFMNVPIRGRRVARHRRRHLRPRQARRVPRRDGHPRPRLQLPPGEQPLQRLQPDAPAHDRDGGLVGDAPSGWAFGTVLVANRGEIARRVIRTARRLGLRTVAVYSEADRAAPHVREADEAILIGGPRPGDSYLNGPAMLAAAKACGCRGGAPRLRVPVRERRLRPRRRIGRPGLGRPDARADRVLRRQARRPRARPGGRRAADARHGLLSSAAQAVEAAASIGFPVMLKATSGGGGIGLAACHAGHEVAEAFDRVSRLAAAHFVATGTDRPRPGCSLSAWSAPPGTWRCRSSATARAVSSCSVTGTARCNAATRRSSRRPPRPAFRRCCASSCTTRPARWRPRSGTARPGRSSSSTTRSGSKRRSWKSTPGSRSSTRSRKRSTASTWSSRCSAWPVSDQKASPPSWKGGTCPEATRSRPGCTPRTRTTAAARARAW